ncbi:MAG: hypothetical protein ABW172_13815, partial [Candidatus Binatia bacterium]
VGCRGVVEKGDDPLAAAIGGVEEDFSIAARQIQRLEDTKVTPIFNSAASVSRRHVQMDDARIQPIFGVHFAIKPTDDLFISSSDGKFVTARKVFSSLDNEASDHHIARFSGFGLKPILYRRCRLLSTRYG